jgi:glycosyltransferase involved in cell wall biosynthesis
MSQRKMQHRFVFWQFAPNEHEAGYIQRIAELGYECYVVCQNDIPWKRKELGIIMPDYGNSKIIFYDESKGLPDCVKFNLTTDVHVFTGIRAFDLTKSAFGTLRKTEAKLVLISESRRSIGLLGFVRKIDSYINERYIKNRIDAVFAMGELGLSWFCSVGYSKSKLYEFCYTVGSKKLVSEGFEDSFIDSDDENVIKIAFVGQFIKRKRIDVLLAAFKKICETSRNYRLQIVGDGAEKHKIEKIIKDDELNNNCCVLSPICNADILDFFKKIDLLILPSEWDGWGAVVNEALKAGAFVIVSNKCGAATLKSSGIVTVFKSGDVNDLYEKIINYKKNVENRSKARNLAYKIDGKIIGDYFLECVLKGGKVVPPWKDC